MNQPDLSIVIVNWRSAAFTRKCLETIYANTEGLNFEVLVIDNASFDGCGEMIRNEFLAVKFLQSSKNVGFAEANNLASRHSLGRNLLFLNPDTEVVGSALQTMCSALQGAPDAGAVGCKLLNSDGTIQTSCIQRYPTILDQLLDAEQLRNFFPQAKVWGIRPLSDDPTGPVPVEVISGACLMITRQVFEQIGQFSTDYFMYAEDVDLCFRAQRAGYRNYFVGQAAMIHHGGGSSDSIPKDNFAAIVMRDSLYKFMRKHKGNLYAMAYRTAMAVAAGVRMLLVGVAFLITLGQLRRRSLSAALTKWAKVLRWAVGLESWVTELKHRDSSEENAISVTVPKERATEHFPLPRA